MVGFLAYRSGFAAGRTAQQGVIVASGIRQREQFRIFARQQRAKKNDKSERESEALTYR
jgi:hypothetical protein